MLFLVVQVPEETDKTVVEHRLRTLVSGQSLSIGSELDECCVGMLVELTPDINYLAELRKVFVHLLHSIELDGHLANDQSGVGIHRLIGRRIGQLLLLLLWLRL